VLRWFGVLEYFGGALQLGLTATPRELEEGERALTDVEKRRDTQHYFGDPTFTYSLKQAIEDGYLVPYLLEERISNVDEDGFIGPDGKRYPDYLADQLLDIYDQTKDPALLAEIQAIFDREEPDVRMIKAFLMGREDV
jgi:type I restriction enzyme R subunit